VKLIHRKEYQFNQETQYMKPIAALLLGVTAVTLLLVGYANAQKIQSTGPRSGKALISSLPGNYEGVEIKQNMVKAKPGYKLIKQSKDTVVVAMINGGGGLGNSGSWSCGCSPGGSCGMTTDGTSMWCSSKDCKNCTLTVSTGAGRMNVIAYSR
jgi:hypothetical protein